MAWGLGEFRSLGGLGFLGLFRGEKAEEGLGVGVWGVKGFLVQMSGRKDGAEPGEEEHFMTVAACQKGVWINPVFSTELLRLVLTLPDSRLCSCKERDV